MQYLFSALHVREIVKSRLSNTEGIKIKTPKRRFTNSKSWHVYISKFYTECLRYKINIISISPNCFIMKRALILINKNFVPTWSEGPECLPFINRAESRSQKYVAWFSGCSTTCSPALRGHASCGLETLKSFSEIPGKLFWGSEIPSPFPDS